MQDHEALLTQSRELVATAQATVASSRRASTRARLLVARARAIVRYSQEAADGRHADRLASAHIG